jgi:hypothetical protein
VLGAVQQPASAGRLRRPLSGRVRPTGRRPMAREESFATVSDALRSARSVAELLDVITEKARELAGAHQAATSVVLSGDWTKAIHAVSLSGKYATWRTYEERPDGSGIYRLVCELNRPMRLTQVEVEAHPAWRDLALRPSGTPRCAGGWPSR